MITFDEQVAIVTGAGHGLGRSHAISLAERGARVVVNDLGGARDGTGSSLTAAESVVAEIEAAGGEAMADGADVTGVDLAPNLIETATRRARDGGLSVTYEVGDVEDLDGSDTAIDVVGAELALERRGDRAGRELLLGALADELSSSELPVSPNNP